MTAEFSAIHHYSSCAVVLTDTENNYQHHVNYDILIKNNHVSNSNMNENYDFFTFSRIFDFFPFVFVN